MIDAPGTSPDVPRAGAGGAVRGGSAIAVAIGLMNVSTYAFTILSARVMGPRPFGAFAAVMNVLLVCGVLALALQTTAARRIAREPADVAEVEQRILVVGRRASIGLGALLLVLAPAVNYVLRLDSILTALLLAVAVVPTTVLGAQTGVLQGERRWIPLALVYLAAGIPRVILGALFLLVRQDALMAIAAVTLGAFVPVLVAGIALRRRVRPPGQASAQSAAQTASPDLTADTAHSARALWSETLYNSQALLAFLVLSSIDVILARNALDLHDAGLYAGGLIMVKAVTFLPQFVVVLAFPAMGSKGAGRSALLASLALVAVTGVAVTLGVQVLPKLALAFVGGSDYTAIGDRLWLFAVLGTLISMLQLLVYNVLAKQARRSVVVLWASLVPLVVAGLTSHTVLELVTRVLIVDAALLVVLLVIGLRRAEPEAGPQDEPGDDPEVARRLG